MRADVRLGAKLAMRGETLAMVDPIAGAIAAEEAGFDSVWVEDHVVAPTAVASTHPHFAGGKPPAGEAADWEPEAPQWEALTTLAGIAAATERIEVGTAVLVLAMRNPLLTAKQLATVEQIAPGRRLSIGVGIGWLAEEYAALAAPFARRGSRMEEWMELMRGCWDGTAGPWAGDHYALDQTVHCRPTPRARPQLLVGGLSAKATDRAGRLGDGWLPAMRAEVLDPDALARGIDAMRRSADAAGREVDRVTLRMGGEVAPVRETLRRAVRAGVTDVVVDVSWREPDGVRAAYEAVAGALA